MIGTRILGAVDRIPGIGCVKTKFFSLLWIPIFPLGSYFVFEGTEKPSFAFYGLAFSLGTKMQAIEVPLNSRSVLYGYIGGIFSYIALLMGGLIALLLFNGKTSTDESTILTITIPIEILIIISLIAASKFNVANIERRDNLIKLLKAHIPNLDQEVDSSNGLKQEDLSEDEKHLAMGIEHYKQKNYHGTIKSLNKAISFSPNNAVYYATRGFAFRKLNQWDNSLSDLTKAIELNPNSPGFHLDRADTYKEMGNYEAAKHDYAVAAKLGNEEAIQLLKELEKLKKAE